MMTKKIKLSSIHEAVEFVRAAEACRLDVDVVYNKIMVDGKSILGVCSLDLSHILTIQYREQNTLLEAVLDKYQAA